MTAHYYVHREGTELILDGTYQGMSATLQVRDPNLGGEPARPLVRIERLLLTKEDTVSILETLKRLRGKDASCEVSLSGHMVRICHQPNKLWTQWSVAYGSVVIWLRVEEVRYFVTELEHFFMLRILTDYT